MKIIISLVYFSVFSVILMTCKKVKPGIETTVTGYAIDSAKNKRLANASVIIYGCNVNFYGRSCGDSLKVVQTDSKGNFDVSFISDGRYLGYDVGISYNDPNYNTKGRRVLTPGIINKVILAATELSVLKFDLKIVSNPIGEISVAGGKNRYFLKGNSNDVSLYFKVQPNKTNDLRLSVWDQKIGRYRFITEKVVIGVLDTTVYQKTIQSTDEFPLNY